MKTLDDKFGETADQLAYALPAGWVKARYAAHIYPRQVHCIETLPKTASGKVQRFVLRQRRRDEMATVSVGSV